jgi:hypothetical protein
VHDKSGEKLATLFGKWDEAMYYVMGDIGEKHKSYDPMSEAVQLWQCASPAKHPTRYGLTAFATTVNELTPGLKEKLPPTDARLRPDQRHLENGEYDDANAEKLRLEKKQRRVSYNSCFLLSFTMEKELGCVVLANVGVLRRLRRGEEAPCSHHFKEQRNQL